VADLEATASQKDDAVRLQGKLTAENWKIATKGSPAKRPLEFDFTIAHNRGKLAGDLTAATSISEKLWPRHRPLRYSRDESRHQLHACGTESSRFRNRARASRNGRRATRRRDARWRNGFDESQSLRARFDRLVTIGSVALSNVRLANFDLGSKLQTLQAIAGIKPTRTRKYKWCARNFPGYAGIHQAGWHSGRGSDARGLNGAGVISASHAPRFQNEPDDGEGGGIVPGLEALVSAVSRSEAPRKCVGARFTPESARIAPADRKIAEKNAIQPGGFRRSLEVRAQHLYFRVRSGLDSRNGLQGLEASNPDRNSRV